MFHHLNLLHWKSLKTSIYFSALHYHRIFVFFNYFWSFWSFLNVFDRKYVQKMIKKTVKTIKNGQKRSKNGQKHKKHCFLIIFEHFLIFWLFLIVFDRFRNGIDRKCTQKWSKNNQKRSNRLKTVKNGQKHQKIFKNDQKWSNYVIMWWKKCIYDLRFH